MPLGLKYGANPEEAAGLLATAARLGLDVVGVSFHVGSACGNLAAYSAAIGKAREVRIPASLRGTSVRAQECAKAQAVITAHAHACSSFGADWPLLHAAACPDDAAAARRHIPTLADF